MAGGLCEVEIKIVPPWHLLEAGIEDIRAKGPISSVNCYGRLAIASSVIRRYGGVGEGEGIERIAPAAPLLSSFYFLRAAD